MLDFLGLSYSLEEVRQRLADDVTTFQRHKPSMNFDPYTIEQRNSVQREVELLIAYLKDGNEGNTLGVEQFLHSDSSQSWRGEGSGGNLQEKFTS